MEVLIGLISFTIIWGGLIEAFQTDKSNKYRITALVVVSGGVIQFILVWWIAIIFTEDVIAKHTNVLEYENIVYSIPKTITETKTVYPWWSIREDIEYEATIE